MNPETDHEWYEGVVLTVQASEDDSGWEVEWRDADRPDDTYGWTLWCPNKGIEPHPGDTLRLYGRGVGHPFRGIALNGRTVFYKTQAEQEAEWTQQEHARERKRRADYEEHRDDYRRRIRALPAPFRQRIEGFQDRNADFDWRFLTYELMCCEDAMKIADALKTAAAIKAWCALPWEQQKDAVPGLDDGHSGNSFAAATRLAIVFLMEPDAIPREHGALCPLVGCREYGCWAVVANAAD